MSTENGDGNNLSSKGSLKTVSGDCLSSTVNGIFKKGVIVTDSNYIKVDIDVAATGAYEVSTDTVNGVYFKSIGVFSSTGINSIVLKSFGTPSVSGTFTFTIHYDTTTCPVDVLVSDPNAPSAVFSFTVSAGTCMGAIINGAYKQGTVLNSSNTVILNVTSTTAGPYSIKTTPVNGITFTGSGVLSGTGSQSVTLTATGTPTAAGNFNISAMAGASSCTFSVSVLSSLSTEAVFTLGGAGAACTGAVIASTYQAGVAANGSNTVKINIAATTAGTYSISTAVINGVIFSGSGMIPGTGTQVITLAASGTPTAPGTYNVSVKNGGSTCTFSIIVKAAVDNAAIFSLAGAGSTCTGASLAGIFKAGTVLTSGNTVTINVDVAKAGAYTIFTNTINGVQFNASGTFTNTGNQKVILKGSGMPAASGDFNFSVTAGSTSCIITIPFTASSVSAVFNLSGAPNTCSVPIVNGTYTESSPVTLSNYVTIMVNVTTAGSYSIKSDKVNGVDFSATGVFSNTGNNIPVKLIASGTPLASGTSTFTPISGSSSCTFNVIIGVQAEGVFTCKDDGVFTSFYSRAQAKNEDLFGTLTLILDGFTAEPDGDNHPELSFYINNIDNSPVTTGSYNVDGDKITSGYHIEVDYLVENADLSFTRWNTSSSTFLGANPPFTINITSITATRIKGTFSGKLSDNNTGSAKSKTITEGVFDLPIK